MANSETGRDACPHLALPFLPARSGMPVISGLAAVSGRLASPSAGKDDHQVKYEVEARRWEHGWELHVAGVGVTQSRTLDAAERTVRDYIESLTGADCAAADIVIRSR